MVIAKWTGHYPCLCYGEWELVIDGIDYSDMIPEMLRHSPMNTYKTYKTWHFDSERNVSWESYIEGMNCDEWINENKEWLNKITDNSQTQCEIYSAINSQDFRTESCGGCI